MKTKGYEDVLSESEIEEFYFKLFGDDTFKEDYENAVEYAKNNGGYVYTMVDGDDGEILYLKGLHYVNRFAFCVLKIEGIRK